MFKAAVTAFLLLLISFEARADWQYSRWGMTVDDLMAAGKGSVVRVSDSEADKARMGNGLGAPLAKASYRTNDFVFTAWFFFPKGKLAGVRLVGADGRQAIPIEQQLERVYGAPFEKEETKILPQCKIRSAKWKDDASKNYILFSGVGCYPENPKIDSAAILYQPTATKSESGL